MAYERARVNPDISPRGAPDMRVSLLLLCATLTGCGGQPNGQQPPIVQPVEQAQPVAKEPAWKTQWPHIEPPKLTRVYKGLNAQQWFRLFEDVDNDTSVDASVALYYVGEDGDYFLVKALRSTDSLTRQRATTSLPAQRLKHMKSQLGPELVKLLHDGYAITRSAAAFRLAELEYVESLPQIKQALQRETNEQAKIGLTNAIARFNQGPK